MPLSPEEQELMDWLKSSIPRWLAYPKKGDGSEASDEELWNAAVKSLINITRQTDDWKEATFILTATDIWLNAHAQDRGTNRQGGETDDALRERIRTVEDAVNKASIISAVNKVLVAAGIMDSCAIVELRKDKAYFLTDTPAGGTNGTFTKSGTTMTLDTGYTLSGYERGKPITIAGATSSGNNGTFTITDILLNSQVSYTNGSGVAEAGAGTWQLNANYDGRKDAYMGRGYRMSLSGHNSFIIILPYPTDADTGLAVREALRQKKAGGFQHIVEVRQNP